MWPRCVWIICSSSFRLFDHTIQHQQIIIYDNLSSDHSWEKKHVSFISLIPADKDHVTRWASAGLEQPTVPLWWVPGRQRRVRGIHSGRLCSARERCCGLQGILPGTTQICRKRQGSTSLPGPLNREMLVYIQHNTTRETHGSISLFKPYVNAFWNYVVCCFFQTEFRGGWLCC